MTSKTYSHGIIFWIDDSLEDVDFPADAWAEIFGNQSDRVYRLFDLHLEVATSYDEALRRIESFESYKEAGTFIYTVLDLLLPARGGMQPAMKYGVALAKELQKRGLTFVFLSANTGGIDILDEEHLGSIPYHVKEPGSVWRFPNSLVLNVLSELRRRLSWISVEDLIMAMNEKSDIQATYRTMPDSFRYFPYFGLYREFVERCEYRGTIDLIPAIAIRSPRKHCDEFVQQCLLIILHQTLLSKPSLLTIFYGHAHDTKYLDTLYRSDVMENPDTINVIRVTPEHTSIDQLRNIVHSLGMRAGNIIFVLPNDESVDQYIELLRGFRILAKEELPQIRLGDKAHREELLRHSCLLTFHLWSRNRVSGEAVSLDKGSLTHPELLINPIHWFSLLETTDVPEALSDPFEIVKELNQVLQCMDARQQESILLALQRGRPVPYDLLLRVGHAALVTSEFKDKIGEWIERTLDTWLKTSWQYPYGILEGFSQRRIQEFKNQAVFHRDVEQWQDSCYEILVGICVEYENHKTSMIGLKETQLSIRRVLRFIKTLGGVNFLTSDINSVNWDELALLRWPHRQYPMPSAVLRRLREAGRYLWIQPEGLDIATTLPSGRQRYRMLSSIVDRYWSVLSWLRAVHNYLPNGWQESIGYLADIVSENRVASAWRNNPNEVWYALLALLRNGCPILFLSDQIVRGKSLVTGKESARKFLMGVKGYGEILGRIRGSRRYRVGEYLVPNFDLAFLHSDLERLRLLSQYLGFFDSNATINRITQIREFEDAVGPLINSLSKLDLIPDASDTNRIYPEINRALMSYFSDPELKVTQADGWFNMDLATQIQENIFSGDLPSLFGTKVDYIWQMLDLCLCLDNLTRYFRYFDGYHFLASLNDLRIQNKDTCPNVPISAIETTMDLFIMSIEGILAQLAWCVEVSKGQQLAERIRPANIQLVLPDDYKQPSSEDLQEIIRVNNEGDEWEVYTLGIPGGRTVNKLCYHNKTTVKEMEG
jgi:hypothetical protein